MARAWVVVTALAVAGCTSVRMVKRDGCWIEQTSRPGQVRERLGTCSDPAELEALRQRLAETAADRDAYRNRAEHEHVAREASGDREREALQATAAKLAEWLGQAATKASQPATATALSLSDGRALSASDGVPGLPAALASAPAAKPVRAPRARAPAPPACAPAPKPAAPALAAPP